MFEDYAQSLLRSGIIEAKAGQKDMARRYLDRAILQAGTHEVMCEGWFWMSQVIDDPTEKRKALENCLALDLYHSRARRELAILDGKLKREDIVDPNNLPPVSNELRNVSADRFMCPQCGGRMTFAPDGQTLTCDYCSSKQTLETPNKEAAEKDFIAAMATMRGHSKPERQQIFHCQGCGAEYILPPTRLSKVCAYCGSPHVIKLEETRELFAPEGIIPHAINQKQAIKYLIQWVELNQVKPEKKVDAPRGLYLPVWTFDIGGYINYTGERTEEDDDDEEDNNFFMRNIKKRVVCVNENYPVMVDDMPIPASRKIAPRMAQLLPTYNIKAIKPYDARYLSNWPAEVYDIPMANASLDARSQAYKNIKRDLPEKLYPMRIISSSSANMMVESFKLVLLPIWMTSVSIEGNSNLILINGQTGATQNDPIKKVEDKKSSGGLLAWLENILDDD